MSASRWAAWHDAYDEPGSPHARRLAEVQARVSDALAACPPGPIRILSLCAGEGRDLLGVLPDHPRRDDVRARLIEMDPANVAVAREHAAAFPSVEVVCGDAGDTSSYVGAVPADVVMVCGVFGNISDDDISATIAALPGLCASDAFVVWTRHRRPPDATEWIRRSFTDAGFEEQTFFAPDGLLVSVGTNRFVGEPRPFLESQHLFAFFDDADGAMR
jgi:hypothetical protein